MQQNFEQALKYVLIDEGGNDDDPVDSGGRTSRGITQSEYDAWCRLHSSPTGDVWRANDDTIKAIYHVQYWLPYCDSMPMGVDYEFFDMAVNMGMHEAIAILQRALGVSADGHYGVITAAAVKNIVNFKAFIDTLSKKRQEFYITLVREHPKDVKFERGWLNRVNHAELNAERIESVSAIALAMRGEQSGQPDVGTV